MIEIDISAIIEGERFRKAYNGISELANSIRVHGLIQPIVVDRALNLIAGGRRLAACRHLGTSTIKVVYRDEVDELTRRELELEENLHREDLTWVESASLTSEIDRLKRLKYGDGADQSVTNRNNRPDGPTPIGWDTLDTAESLGVSQATVSRDLTASRMIDVIPELANETDRKTAMVKFDKLMEKLERELAVRTGDIQDDNIHFGDFLELSVCIPDKSIDLIIFDPPYGTRLDKLNQGIGHSDTHFDDSVKDSVNLLKKCMPVFERVLKPSGHIYCFCGLKVVDIGIARQPLYALFADVFDKAGFKPDYIPLVWTKNTAGLVEFDYRYGFQWEPILFIQNQEMRRLSQKRTNVFQFDSVPGVEKANLAQKPEALLEELIRMSTAEGEVVLDPMAGSGPTVRAAHSLNRRYVVFEKDRDQYNSILRSMEVEVSDG